jgi:hypothetical protein
MINTDDSGYSGEDQKKNKKTTDDKPDAELLAAGQFRSSRSWTKET